MQTYRINPTVPRGYVLNDARGALGVVVPEATVNQCKNPSIETNLTGWFSNGANIARTIGVGRRGLYGLVVTPLTATGLRSVDYSETGLVSSEPCTVSIDLNGGSGRIYHLTVTHGSETLVHAFAGHGIWQRESITIAALSATSISISVALISPGVQPFMVDGLQIEAKQYATTYVDGDLVGFVRNQTDFYWNGVAHASTSTRTAQTRAGGRVVMFDSFGWKLLSIIGLSMFPLSVLAQPLATGGSYYQTTLAQERAFSLVGDLYGSTEIDLQRRKDELTGCLNPFLTSVRQPLVLVHQRFDQCGRLPLSEASEIVAHYTGGMEGTYDNNYQERIAGEFRMFLPYIVTDQDHGADLDAYQSFAGGNYIAQRATTGNWGPLTTGTNSTVNAILHIGGGQYYVGGAFTLAGGVANTARIAKWTGTAWQALGTGGAGGDVLAMAIAPNGDLVVAGTFTSMGGVANTLRIARWNGSAWSALGSGLDGAVNALTFGTDGSILYAGGDFLNSGATPLARIATWNGTAWSALGAGANGTVNALHRKTYGEIYVGGNFTTIGGVAANRIALYNGSVFSALGTGSASVINSIVSDGGGLVYAGGAFTSIGGVAANRIASWNGTAWSALGTGTDNTVSELHIDDQGLLYAGGIFTTAGGVILPDPAATWNGTVWMSLDFNSGGTTVTAFATEPNAVLTVAYDINGMDSTAALTTITYDGTADTYPVIAITGPTGANPSRIYQLTNRTTGAAIYFNLAINPGEVITLTLDPTNISFVSSFRGNIIGDILPGSNVSNWYLQPGTNNVTLFAFLASVTATIRWREQFLAIENTVIR